MKIILKKDIVKERTSVKLSVLFALLFLTVLGNAQDTLSSDFPQYQDPVVEPVIEPYVSILNLCDDTHDFYFEFVVKDGYYKASEEVIEVSSILVYADNDYLTTINNTVNGEGVSWQGEAYKYFTTYDEVEFTFKLLDINYEYITEYTLVRQLKKNGEINASQRVFKAMFDWKTTVSSGGYTSGPPIGPTTSVTDYNYLFTYLCGQSFYKVELLAFIQEYFQLNEEEMCAFRAEYETFISTVNYDQSVLINWSGEFCDLLEKYWTMYKETKNPPNGGTPPSECECKVINSRVTVDHSLGASTSVHEEECREVFAEEGHLSWYKGAPGKRDTETSHNWGNILYGYSGAAKSLVSHSKWGRNLRETVNMEKFLPSSILKSGIQFLMVCINPKNAEIDLNCNCSKKVEVVTQYVSHVDAYANSGGGKIKSCMNDFAALSKFGRDSIDIIQTGFFTTCVECESNDTTNIFTDLGTLSSSIESVIPTVIDTGGFQFSKIDDYFNAAGTVKDAVDRFFDFTPECGQFKDTTVTLLNLAIKDTLSSENDFVSYIVSSYAKTRTFDINDESRHDMQLISDYYIGGKLTTLGGDSICCNELVGAYSIGTLAEFENDNLGQAKFTNLYSNSPLGLARMQRDLGTYFYGPVFVEDVFKQEACCTADVNCYFNCGYWGECNNHSEPRSSITPFSGKIRVFPIPSKIGNNLRYDIQFDDDVSLQVLNLYGNVIYELNNIEKTGELPSQLFSSEGFYFIRFHNSDFDLTEKILFVK
jgi:hypothetical protein